MLGLCATAAVRAGRCAVALAPARARPLSSAAPNVVEIIAKKRNGEELSTPEIQWFINSFTDGAVADYQASAWLMAVCLQGMTARETADLTAAMTNSGSVADLSDVPGAKVPLLPL